MRTQRIASRFGLALRRRLVQLLVVGERVRVRPRHRGVHQRRTVAVAGVRHGLAHRPIAGEEVGAVAAEHAQAEEALDDARDVAAGGLHFDRHGDRVAVVFDQIDDRQLALAGGVERFPELAFAGAAFANRDVGDFVRAKALLAVGDLRSTRA